MKYFIPVIYLLIGIGAAMTAQERCVDLEPTQMSTCSGFSVATIVLWPMAIGALLWRNIDR